MKSQNKILEFRQKIDALEPTKKQALFKKLPKISGGQKGVWFKYREDRADNSYNLGFLMKIMVDLDPSKIQEAALKTLNRHVLLRVFFYEYLSNVHMVQIPGDLAEVPIISLADTDAVKAYVRNDYARPFQLEDEVPTSFTVFITPDGIHLSFIAHHIVVDGHSLSVIKQSLRGFLQNDKDSSVESVFMETINDNSAAEKKQSIEFWGKYYEGFENQLIRWDAERGLERGQALDLSCALPSSVNNLLEKYAAKRGCLPFSVLNLALGMTIFKCKRVSNFFIGSTLLNRGSEREFNSVGMYINTIKMKHQFQPYSTLGLAIQKLDQEFLEVMEHGRLSYLEMLDELNEISVMVPFQVVLEYQRQSSQGSNGPFGQDLDVRNRRAKFDLSMFVTRTESNHVISLEYDSAKISQNEAERLLNVFIDSIRWIVEENEEERLVNEFFDKEALSLTSQSVSYAHDSLSSLIRSWASQCLEDTVILGKRTYTKKDFLGLVTRYAETFSRTESPVVPLWTTRSGHDLALMLGAWVANKKFLALDKNWPIGRLYSVIDDLGSKKIYIADERAEYPECFEPIRFSDSSGTIDPGSDFTSRKSGYIIYSSGTTGKPNGTTIPETAVLNLIYGLNDFLKEIPFTRVALNALFSFDASIQQFVLLLLNKSILVLDEKERHDIDLLVEVLNREKIELLDGTPSFLKILFQEDVFRRVPSLKVFLVGGEKLEGAMIRRICEEKGVKFFNVYGPCECAVDTTVNEVTADTIEGELGYPLGSTTFVVVDEDFNIVPKGQTGQLVIFGNSLGSGYLNRKELTEKKFIYFDNDILQDKFGYLTGDLGYIRPDGSIMIKGRMDDQIKKNGARIELAEIANGAKRSPQVDDACCLFDRDSQKIVLFVKPHTVDVSELRHFLKSMLPAYMMPEEILTLQKFDLNNSGKVDLKGMYEKHKLPLVPTQENSLELNRIEEELSEIWKNHLKITSISDKTDFFEAGGNSLIAFKLLKDIRKVIKVKLNISQIFSHTTFSAQLALIEQNLRLLSRGSQTTGNHIMDLKEEEASGPALFCIHAVGGSVGSYFKIAKGIRFKGAIYGVTGFSDEAISDLNAYASALVTQMMKKDLTRGIWLLGWSFGGLLSLTISRKLQDQGVQIHGIFLIDTFYSPSKKTFEANFGLFSIVNTVLGKHGIRMDQELEEKLSALSISGSNVSQLRGIKEHLSQKYGIDFDLDDDGVIEVSRMASYHRSLANSFMLMPGYLSAPIFAAYAQESLDALADDAQTLIDQGAASELPLLLGGNHYSIVYDPKLLNFINDKLGKLP